MSWTGKAANHIASAILSPHVDEFSNDASISSTDFELGEVVVSDESPLAGRSVSEYGATEPDVVFVAINHVDGHKSIRPKAEDRFRAGDIVIVAGNPGALARMGSETQHLTA